MASSHVYLLENLILESQNKTCVVSGPWPGKQERGSEMSEQILSSVKMIKYDRQGQTGLKITIHFKI